MLSPEDAELVQRERAVVGLATLLDPQALLARLRTALPAVETHALTMNYLRYKPGENCLAGYTMHLGEHTWPMYARALRADSHNKLEKLQQESSVNSLLGVGSLFLQRDQIAINFFPNDRRLIALARLAAPELITKLLRKVLRKQPDVGTGAVRTLRYKPERRYVAQWEGAQGSQALLKFYTSDGFQTAAPAARLRSQGPLKIAKRLGRSHRHKLIAFEWLNGQVLSGLELEYQLQALPAVGVALAELHKQEIHNLNHISRQQEVSQILAITKDIAYLCPNLAQLAENVSERLVKHLLNLPQGTAPIHGDFYADQLLVDNSEIAMIDFDEATFGDPMADVGNFMAHAVRDSLNGKLPISTLSELQHKLFAGYADNSRSMIPEQVEFYTAVGLLRLASDPFRRREANWPEKIAALLEHSAARLPRGSFGANQIYKDPLPPPTLSTDLGAVTVSDPLRAIEDSKLPTLRLALDPLEAQNELSALVLKTAPSTKQTILQAIRVVRHKPQRRCLVEYDLELCHSDPISNERITLIGKLHAKRFDRPTYELMHNLYRAGFHENSPDGISVPKPMGSLERWSMWFQRKVSGKHAMHLLLQSDGISLARRMAQAIHKLHAANIPQTRTHSIHDELRILHDRLSLVATEFPMWRERITRMLHACDQLGQVIASPKVVCGIHRDFYPDQVLVNGERLYLLDFDLYALGAPALDAGNFLGHLIEYSVRSTGNIHLLSEQQCAFESSFLEYSRNTSPIAIQIYTTLTLVRHIYLSTQFPERRAITASLLELCEQRLSSHTASCKS